MDDLDLVRLARGIIAERLETIFRDRGKLTIREIAAECGVSASVLSLYIRGFVVEGKFLQICKFLHWLGIDPTTFAERLGWWKG